MEPREMTADELEKWLGAIAHNFFADGSNKLRAHIAALTARAERAEKALADARDAALEEVATEAEYRASIARRVYVGTEREAAGNMAGDALKTLAEAIRTSRGHSERISVGETMRLVALEEAAAECLSANAIWDEEACGFFAELVRALKSHPARRFVDAEKVREVLNRLSKGTSSGNDEFDLGWDAALIAVGGDLGVSSPEML